MAFITNTRDPDYRRTKGHRFRTPTRAVRAEADATTWWDDLAAVSLVLPTSAVFSHTTAAHIAGLPLPEMDPRPFHATVPKSRGSRKAVIWHQRDLSEVVCEHRGFRVTTPERTYQDLASLLPLADLVAVADHLLRHKLLGADQLARVPPVPGSALLRRAAEMADPASASPKESTLRVEMLTRGLPVPRLNLEIIEDGGWIGCGDFVWPKWKVIADYDGEHHADPKQRAQDNATRDDYAHYGWRHVALDKKQITHMDKAIERVASALRDRGWQPGRDAGPVWHKAPKART